MGVQPDIVAEIDDMAMLRLVAREHRGLTVVPPIVVRDELERGELVEYARIPGIRETFYALTVPRRFTHRALPQLLAHVTELDWGSA
jgi:LysR family transcriptional activator of nhaA